MEIELRQVSKSFGRVRALQSIDLHLRGGELALVTGPNGSGKSTLLKILATALAPDEGEYVWDGKPVHDALDQARRSLGYLGERNSLYEDLTVEENLIFWARVYGRSWRAQELSEALKLWNMEAYRSRPVRNLSQGMSRRTGLAKIGLQNPGVVLLDEPFNGLDSENCEVLVGTLSDWKSAGKTIVLATHQPGIAEGMMTQRLVLREGRVDGSLQPELCRV